MHKITCKIALLGLLVPCLPAVAQQKEFNALDHILQKRPRLDTIPAAHWYDNIFVSGAIGAEGVMNGVGVQPGRSRYGLTGAVYLGKWFNATSALRLGIQAGIPQHQLKVSGTSRYFVHTGFTADYMFNLNNFLYGYNPKRIFSFLPFAGAGIHIGGVLHDKNRLSGSFRIGAQGTLRISQGLNFFIEPSLQLYTDDYNQEKNWRQFDIVPTVMAGLTYTMVPKSLRLNVSPFYNEKLFHNMFVTAGVGGGILVSGSTMNRLFYNHVGPEFFVGIGNWFTSVSGARLSVTGNVYKARNEYLSMFGGQLDYMINLDALFEGYHPERIFRLYGVAGLNVAFPEKNGRTGNTVGGGIGVQANFRLSSTTDIFLEPRVNVFPTKFAGGFTTNKVDIPATMVLGLTYHRPDNGSYKKAQFESNNWADNTFFSIGGGLNSPISGYVRSMRLKAIQPYGTAAVGKWFTPISGLRASGQIGLLGEQNSAGQAVRSKLVGAELDYMLNVSNFIGGYNPTRVLSLNAFLGGSCVFNNATDRFSPRGFEFGVVGGVQGLVRIAPSFQLYLEPKLGMYTDDLTVGSYPPLSKDLLFSLSAGLIYNFRQYDLPVYRELFQSKEEGKWFASLSGGVGTVLNSAVDTCHMGPQGALCLGKEYTPISAWRTAIRYTHFPELPKHKNAQYQSYYGLDIDYMLDITTMAAGYIPDRIFRFHGIIGPSVGVAESRKNIKFVPGAHIGFQASLRFNKSISFYIEPRADMFGKYFMNNNNGQRFDSSLSALAGITWRFSSLSMKKE